VFVTLLAGSRESVEVSISTLELQQRSRRFAAASVAGNNLSISLPSSLLAMTHIPTTRMYISVGHPESFVNYDAPGRIFAIPVGAVEAQAR
jgi:hypothetical protein